MPEPLQLTDQFIIADNPGWRFGVARIGGDRWIGFAREGGFSAKAKAFFAGEGLEATPSILMVFPEVSDGFNLGTLDRERSILLTGALAQDPESAYGGVERWFVPADLRGDPEKFRCVVCERVGWMTMSHSETQNSLCGFAR